MNQNEILSALQLNPGKGEKLFAARLAKVFELHKALKNLPGFAVAVSEETSTPEMIKALKGIPHKIRNAKEVLNYFEAWRVVEFKHNHGAYSFNIPSGKPFTDSFLALVGIPPAKKIETKVLETITIPSAVLKALGTATAFVSKDFRRPVFMNVCLAFENNQIEVVATDAHRLYISEPLPSTVKERREYQISVNDAKALSKLKTTKETIEILVLKGNKIQIENTVYDLYTDKNYVNYRAVVPDYDKYIAFERKGLVTEVKKVLPFANKATHAVQFHFNGAIEMTAQDIDFSFETKTRMKYVEKNFEVLDIAFDGNLLNNCLAAFKDETLKMYVSDQNTGRNCTKAGVLTNGKERVLVMPVFYPA